MFLHGAGGHTGWMAFLDELAGRFAVFAPEHPGFGQSDDPPWLDEVADLAYFHLDLLKALGLERVHLIGTSLGGWVAAEMAVRSTARLASLTLVGAVGITAERQDDPRHRSACRTTRTCGAITPTRNAPRAAAPISPARWPTRVMAVVAKNRATVTRLAYRPRFHNPGLEKWLHRIDMPTLLIWGEADRLVPPSFGEAYRALIPAPASSCCRCRSRPVRRTEGRLSRRVPRARRAE